MATSYQQQLEQAARHLSTSDDILAPVIKHAGLPDFTPHNDYYGALVGSIIGQQLSVKAAARITERFKDLFDGTWPTPRQILSTSSEALRSVGLSRPKVAYITDLAAHVQDGRVRFDRLDTQTNQEIINELTDVKGVGEWTVHMFLMFCMGRLDVLAAGDLGIRNGIRRLYGLEDIPTPEQIQQLADRQNWHPYESAACWYIWHSLDNQPSA